MKKTLSLALAFIMLVTCMSLTFTANAYSAKDCINITLSGKVYLTQGKQALDEVNAKRAEQGMDKVVLDSSLTNLAKRRAAQLMLYFDTQEDIKNNIETQSNGDSASALIKGFNEDTFTSFGAFDSITKENVYSDASFLESTDFSAFKSAGIVIFRYANVNAYYAIYSFKEATSPLTEVTDSAYKTTEALNKKFIKAGDITLSRKVENKGYNLGYRVQTKGLYSGAITVSNSLVTYASSNNKIVKVKGKKAYTKKSGTVKLYAKNSYGTVLTTNSITASATSYKPTFKSLKSPKKKQLTVKWANNMNNSDGFEIQIATDKKFTKGKKTYTVKGRKKTSYTIKKLKSKKKYYVRVRAYIDQGEGEKFYSAYSSSKNLKVK